MYVSVQLIPSDDYKEILGRRAEHEGHLELYYNVFLNEHLSVSPDFQYIWNPYGKDVSDNTDSVFVYGMRTHIDF